MNVFGKQKIKEDTDEKKEKLLRKVLGKDTGRILRAFLCSPKIWASMKELALQLHVSLYSLLEHAVQLGAIQIAAAMQDPEEREILRDHVIKVHEEQRLVEKIARYDEEAADWLDENRRRQFEVDNIFRKLVVKYGRHVASSEIDGLIEDGMRYRIAVSNGLLDPNIVLKQRQPYQNPGMSQGQSSKVEDNNDD